MVMATNVPILFLGTGQTYSDIKRLSTKTVVEMLLN
jgi:signal recognition particle receptor subunit alpha